MQPWGGSATFKAGSVIVRRHLRSCGRKKVCGGTGRFAGGCRCCCRPASPLDRGRVRGGLRGRVRGLVGGEGLQSGDPSRTPPGCWSGSWRCWAVPAWEAGPDDVDGVVAQLVANGLAASTRRGYVQAFKDFHRFLVVRKAAEIEATFGVHLVDPVDEFNASPPCRQRLAVDQGAADAGADGGVLRVPARSDRHGPQVRTGRPGLRAVSDPVSRRSASRRGGVAGVGRLAFRAGSVRQDPCPVRQGHPRVGTPAAVGADARPARSDLALVR